MMGLTEPIRVNTEPLKEGQNLYGCLRCGRPCGDVEVTGQLVLFCESCVRVVLQEEKVDNAEASMTKKEEFEAVVGKIFAEPFEVKEAKDQEESEKLLREQTVEVRDERVLKRRPMSAYWCERHGQFVGGVLMEGAGGQLGLFCSTCLGEAIKKLGLVPMKRV